MVRLLIGKDNTVGLNVQFLRQYSDVSALITLNGKAYDAYVGMDGSAKFTIPKEDVDDFAENGGSEFTNVRFFDREDNRIGVCKVDFGVCHTEKEKVGFDCIYASVGDICILPNGK